MPPPGQARMGFTRRMTTLPRLIDLQGISLSTRIKHGVQARPNNEVEHSRLGSLENLHRNSSNVQSVLA